MEHIRDLKKNYLKPLSKKEWYISLISIAKSSLERKIEKQMKQQKQLADKQSVRKKGRKGGGKRSFSKIYSNVN